MMGEGAKLAVRSVCYKDASSDTQEGQSRQSGHCCEYYLVQQERKQEEQVERGKGRAGAERGKNG